MARSALRKSPAGDEYELVCDPENEATIYAQALTLNLWPQACEFGGPIALIGCDPNLKGAPATGAANHALGIEGGYNYSFVGGAGHLLQIEKPQACVRSPSAAWPRIGSHLRRVARRRKNGAFPHRAMVGRRFHWPVLLPLRFPTLF
jgi:hypothetical protein